MQSSSLRVSPFFTIILVAFSNKTTMSYSLGAFSVQKSKQREYIEKIGLAAITVMFVLSLAWCFLSIGSSKLFLIGLIGILLIGVPFFILIYWNTKEPLEQKYMDLYYIYGIGLFLVCLLVFQFSRVYPPPKCPICPSTQCGGTGFWDLDFRQCHYRRDPMVYARIINDDNQFTWKTYAKNCTLNCPQ
ncbi:hypothetical protein PCE1_001545 [Barthelona sp. PCE]